MSQEANCEVGFFMGQLPFLSFVLSCIALLEAIVIFAMAKAMAKTKFRQPEDEPQAASTGP